MKKPNDRALDRAAWDETLHLYNGWLAYLLVRLGEETIRVEAADLGRALETLSCRVERDGSGYVIRMAPAEGRDEDGEA